MVNLRLDSYKIRKVRISEKFFYHVFRRWKLTQKTEILIFFAHAFSEKLLEQTQNYTVGKLLEKMKILKNLFFHQNQHKVLIRGSQRFGIFKPWVKSYEAFSIFWPSAILELMISNYVRYGYISNQHFTPDSDHAKFFESAHANFLKRVFLLNA